MLIVLLTGLSLLIYLLFKVILYPHEPKGKDQPSPHHEQEFPADPSETIEDSGITITIRTPADDWKIDKDGVILAEEWSNDLKGKEFRYFKDPPSVIRLSQEAPQGFYRMVRDVSVAGTSYEPARSWAAHFIEGKERQLFLERDPGNSFDPHGVKVIGQWENGTGIKQRQQIGWVPKDLAEALTKEFAKSELTATLWTMYKATRENNPGIRMDIWEKPIPKVEKPKRKRQKKTAPPTIDLRELIDKEGR